MASLPTVPDEDIHLHARILAALVRTLLLQLVVVVVVVLLLLAAGCWLLAAGCWLLAADTAGART